MTTNSPVTVFVCVTCRGRDDDTARPGQQLHDALAASGEVTVADVACLSVCKRPCTVALAAAGKWTYVVGDLHPEDHIGDVLDMARRYAASDDGIVPWRDRPLSFRRGVVSRVPPLGA
jgi:predicted metal-binding protein